MPNSITRSLSGVGREFMQGMGYGALPPSDQVLGRPSPPLELPYMKAKTIVPLPAPESITLPALALRDAIEQRESIRTYALEPHTLPEVAYISSGAPGGSGALST
jgi:hypothetical protein